MTTIDTDDLSILMAPAKPERLTPSSIGGLVIQPVEEQAPTMNMLIYGDPGAGKTVLAGSASVVPDMCPVLFADVEGGTFSLRNTYPNVDVVRIENWIQMQSLFDELHRGGHGYKTIVLDSLTEIQKVSLEHIMKVVVTKDANRDIDLAQLQEYLKNAQNLRRFVRLFRDLPMNTIFTALSLTDKDNTGKITTGVGMGGKLAKEVPGWLDMVLYLYTKQEGEENKRLLLTARTDKFIAKDRSGQLPMIIVQPTMQTIHNLIFAKDK